MANLYFYYAAMNAGKSAILLQTKHNYAERGMKSLLFVPKIGKREEEGAVTSRIGLQAPAISFSTDFNFFDYLKDHPEFKGNRLACVLIDEAQFLKKKQVEQLTDIVDVLNIPVITYGLRTDFLGELFEGSHYLLAWAENVKEIKNVCHCGKKATMNMRIDEKGNKCEVGPQIQIGGNASYIATCRKHFKEGKAIPFFSL